MIEDTIDIPLDVPLLPYKTIRAGELTCIYEAGNLRYIKWGNAEMIKMIYGALRDQHWETIIPSISNETWTEDNKGLSVSYTALYQEGDISYKAAFRIDINHDNSILYVMKGTALSSFKKNRIGLCVLHPLTTCKGQTAQVSRPGGTVYEAVFPKLISPHQPFKDVQKMEWETGDGHRVTLQFHGDVFETEDQRNWSDSSYKTYSTPLELPFPATVEEGEMISQQVLLNVNGPARQVLKTASPGKTIAGIALAPKIGLFDTPRQVVIGVDAQSAKGDKAYHHWRIDLKLDEPGWEAELLKGAERASSLKTKMELVVYFSMPYDQLLRLLSGQLKPFSEDIYSILLLDIEHKATPAELMHQGYINLKKTYPSIKIGYGTAGTFAELNRNRPGELPHDFVSFSLTPMAHAKDARTVMENLESQPDIIETIRSFTSGDIHVSSLTVNTPEKSSRPKHTNDPRALIANSRFGAAWISLAIQQLQGATCITIPRHYSSMPVYCE